MKHSTSFLSPHIEAYVDYRKISNRWSVSYNTTMSRFEKHCISISPDSKILTQEMIDTWYAKHHSYRSQVYVIRGLVIFMNERGSANVRPPVPPAAKPSIYVPHPFSNEELVNFFKECDNLEIPRNSLKARLRKITVPVFFRLLYSSGIRTIEARLLLTENVDLRHGFIDIQYSKGSYQHFVALHDSMTELLRQYDEAVSKICPNREYFFPSSNGKHLSKTWLCTNFNELWQKVSNNRAVAYAFRHHYAVTNINKWIDAGFDFDDKLFYLSKSMGHYDVESTKYYYSLVPSFADILESQTNCDFDEIVPEVCYEEI